jgi:predicted secreted Zn-dependent protease
VKQHSCNGVTPPAQRYSLSSGHIRVVIALSLIGFGLLGSTAASLTYNQTASAAASVVCQPNTTFKLPTPISLSNKPEGLTYVNGGTSYYHVGGSTVTAIRTALNRCAPALDGSGDYLAYTNYTVSWSYAITTGKNNVCTLSNVKVGLHVNQLLPSLLKKTSEPRSIQHKWDTFRIALHTHEDGHTAIDLTQAKGLLSKLQKLSTSCGSVAASGQAVTTRASNSLITANAKHDTDTDYGRDQGAIF